MTILVADDLAIVRELVATCLRVRGYEVICATDGVEALKLVRAQCPDLIVCDISMPEMDGITFLEHLRADPKTLHIPVILLTASSDKDLILRAARLGVTDYLLKARFSVVALIDRVKKRLSSGATAPQCVEESSEVAAAADGVTMRPCPATTRVARTSEPCVRRLDRDECSQRIKQAFQGKMLSDVVAQIMAIVSAPSGDVVQLANLIGRDDALSARIVDAGNSAAVASGGKAVSSVVDAAHQLGFSTFRNAAAGIAIFDAMPPTGAGGSNSIRCWQHSIAVARFCEQLETARSPENAGVAYVLGLCHDLGEILLCSQFGTEHLKILEAEARTGQPRRELEMQILGMTRQQLILTITQVLGLPDPIRTPIEAFHNGNNARDDLGRLCGVLRLADNYASGLMFASDLDAPFTSFARSECRGITGVEEPSCPDAEESRAEIFSVSAMVAKLKSSDDSGLMKPMLPNGNAKIWLARDPALSSYDAIHAALSSLGDVQVNPRLPTSAEMSRYQSLAVLAWKPTTPGFCAPEIQRALVGPEPLLWAVARTGGGLVPGPLTPQAWPISLRQIVDSLTPQALQKQVA